jgi:hypothetical protein
MIIRFSQHAKEERLNERLAEVVGIDDVISAIEANEKTLESIKEYGYILVKRFDKRIYLDKVVTSDTPKGDIIICKVRKIGWNEFLVITVMLRKSTSKSDVYKNH